MVLESILQTSSTISVKLVGRHTQVSIDIPNDRTVENILRSFLSCFGYIFHDFKIQTDSPVDSNGHMTLIFEEGTLLFDIGTINNLEETIKNLLFTLFAARRNQQ